MVYRPGRRLLRELNPAVAFNTGHRSVSLRSSAMTALRSGTTNEVSSKGGYRVTHERRQVRVRLSAEAVTSLKGLFRLARLVECVYEWHGGMSKVI
jgi:hypothetical protein